MLSDYCYCIFFVYRNVARLLTIKATQAVGCGGTKLSSEGGEYFQGHQSRATMFGGELISVSGVFTVSESVDSISRDEVLCILRPIALIFVSFYESNPRMSSKTIVQVSARGVQKVAKSPSWIQLWLS